MWSEVRNTYSEDEEKLLVEAVAEDGSAKIVAKICPPTLDVEYLCNEEELDEMVRSVVEEDLSDIYAAIFKADIYEDREDRER